MFIRGKAYNGITFGLVNNFTGSGVDGGTAIAKITKDGAAAANLASNPTPLGSGLWTMNLTASETDAEFFTVSVHHPSAVYFTLPVKTTSSGSPVFANVTQINSERTDGNNATLSLKQLNLVNNAGYGLISQGTTAGAYFVSSSLKGMIIEGGGDDALYLTSSDGAGLGVHGTNRGIEVVTSVGPGILVSPFGGSAVELAAEQGYYGLKITSTSGTPILASGLRDGISVYSAQKYAMRLYSDANAGLLVQSSDGYGIEVVGASDGLIITGQGGNGLTLTGDSYGLFAQGMSAGCIFNGTSTSLNNGFGMVIQGSTNSPGLKVQGGIGSGDAVIMRCNGSGVGLRIVGANPLADMVANISGDIRGSVASVSNLSVDASGFVRLASGENVYYADIIFHLDDTNSRDEYTVNWFRNGAPYSGGIANQKLWVIKREDGADLIPPTGLASIGSVGAYKVDAYNTLRTTNGLGYIVQVWGDIDNQTRFWRRVISRDVDT
jgi:hypothetical protein